MTGREKIIADHRSRGAFVYVRQSTQAQVMHHTTSTERQFELAQLAETLGWPKQQVEVISEDLGRSGKFSEDRDGFQRLAAEMSIGRVGAVLSLDASRLARSSADWHRLLEVAALTRTLIIDEQSVYDPRDPNDRLVLGMKGTMADFELVWLRQRLEGGRWHRAERGEFRGRPPIGYVWDDQGKLVLDPDEEIRRAVALLFERYRVGASCRDVVKYFVSHALRFPARFGGEVIWKRLTAFRVHGILRNPMYTGAYVYGRSRGEVVLEDGQRRRRVRQLAREDWRVVRRDSHPAYLSWEEFLSNGKRLSDSKSSRAGSSPRGAPRAGAALLQGLLLCGRCSSRVNVRYVGNGGRYANYICSRVEQHVAGDRCLCVMTRNLDEPVTQLVLQTLTRANLDAATKVLELVEKEDTALDKQWQLRIDRARYEAKRAERQYDACDPENRVVARTLETRWNERLTELERLEAEYQEHKRRKAAELSELDRRRIRELADDVPRLWREPTTTDRDRKMLLRLLVKDVSVRAIDIPRPGFLLRVLWQTGAVTEIEVERRGQGDSRRRFVWRELTTSAPRTPEESH